ncbi:MAG: hypothetical protein DRO67_01870 [Candidatus Asgardarchaeum californiense]|nr:MAG: hypothetical protein DRO67_01870 [Candidatus Asgardarchaeum californiense]
MDTFILLSIIVIIFIISVVIYTVVSKNNKLMVLYNNLKLSNHTLKMDTDIVNELNSILTIQTEELSKDITILQSKLNKTVHQKKSSEVRLGKIGENLAPFMDGWPWDPNHFRFLGSPIDGIQFTEDEVLFVEIKTGKSRLSKYQTKCKKLVEEGKVRFVTFRIGEDGTSIK